MCGIAGIVAPVALSETLQRRLLAAAQLMAHRGVDGRGIHVDGGVGFVHNRLAIVDLAGGRQPLLSPEGAPPLACVANGEIYNHVELRRQFLDAGTPASRTNSDSESILAAYAAHGVRGLQLLHGMFAAALHDPQARRVVLARDRLGIKPLYYAAGDGCIVFGSELRAVAALRGQAPVVSADAVAQFLEHEFQPGAATAFEGIRRVPPGHAVVIDERSLRVTEHPFWSLDHVETQPLTQAEAERWFDTLIEEVISQHVRADVPFGLYLSGGLDSGLMCALLSRRQARPLETFSVGYAVERDRNELDAAAAVARRWGTAHTAIELTPDELWSRLPHGVWAADELMDDRAVLPTLALAERTSRSLKIAFTGEGGDEVFAGYARYRRHPLQRLGGWLRSPGTGGYRTGSRWSAGWRGAVFGPALRRSAGSFREVARAAWRGGPKHWSTLQRCQHVDLVTSVPDNLLTKVDRSLMAFGVEGRVPFLDHRLVEFGLALPDTLKVDGRLGKQFLRRWGLAQLPAETAAARKRGFHVPVAALLAPPTLDRLEPALLANEAVREWFQPDGVRRLLEAQRRTGACTDEVWSLLHFALWHCIQVAHGGVAPPPRSDPFDYL